MNELPQAFEREQVAFVTGAARGKAAVKSYTGSVAHELLSRRHPDYEAEFARYSCGP